MSNLDITVVMPVYNEAVCIVAVVEDWLGVLGSLGVRYRLLAINDGSRDGTADALAGLLGRRGFELVTKPNSGHGPTVLMGYRRAVADSDWVFQVDSDNELKAADFPAFWRAGKTADVAIGYRQGRRPAVRRLLSAASRLVTAMLFGRAVRDVNCPYRLMRSKVLAPLLEHLPADTFAPNVAISGMLALKRRHADLRILNLPVTYEGRRTGKASIRGLKLAGSSLRALRQTLQICLALPRNQNGSSG